MKCEEFEFIILGLDRGESINIHSEGALDLKYPAGAAVSLREHAALCAACRALMDEAQELRESLKLLADTDRCIVAPAHIEACLVQAFRNGSTAIERTLIGVTARRLQGRWRLGVPRLPLIIATAAALIIIAVVSIAYLRARGQNQVVAKHDEGSQNATPTPQHNDDIPTGPNTPGPGTVPSEPPRQAPRSHEPPAKRGGLVAGGKSTRIPRVVRNAARGEDTSESEIATEFFPINYGGYLQPLDGGQVLRIKLPRSALRNYGLPFDPLRADEAIKADVVIGNDGMARAIRFVH